MKNVLSSLFIVGICMFGIEFENLLLKFQKILPLLFKEYAKNIQPSQLIPHNILSFLIPLWNCFILFSLHNYFWISSFVFFIYSIFSWYIKVKSPFVFLFLYCYYFFLFIISTEIKNDILQILKIISLTEEIEKHYTNLSFSTYYYYLQK